MTWRYAAFISYSHAADARLATALRSALERFTKPWYRRRALRLFHDETNLSVSPSLWGAILEALDGSEHFILLASPEAARSKWIRREVEHWIEHRSVESLFLVVTAGELGWNDSAGDFVWNDTTPLPANLRNRFHEEPLWLDLTWARDSREHLSLGHDRFRESVADLASVLHARPRDELVGAELREHRRALLLARSAVTGLVVLMLLSVGAALMAARQRDVAEQRRNEALQTQSMFLADLSRQQVEDGNVTNGILLALEALPGRGRDRPYVPEAEAALFDAVGSHRERLLIDLPGDPVTASIYDWSPDGRWLLTSSTGRPMLWDAMTGRPGPRLGVHAGGEIRNAGILNRTVDTGAVLSGAFGPTGRLIATTSNTGRAYLWKTEPGRLPIVLMGHANWSRSARFSPQGTRLVTVSNDGTARVWDSATGEALHVLTHEAQVWTARFSPDGERLLTASSDKTARIWDVESGRELVVLRGHEGELTTAEFDPRGLRVVTGAFDGTARLWNAKTGRELVRLRAHDDGITALAISPDAHRIATGSKSGDGALWDTESGALIRRLSGHSKEVVAVEFDPCGKHLITSTHDATARLWDPGSGRLVDTLRGHEESFLSRVTLAFAPDCSAVATASRDGTVRVWTLESWRPVTAIDPPGTREVISADIAPQAGLIVSSVGDRFARIWELSSGRIMTALQGHIAPIHAVAFSPDASQVVTASDDATARIWDSRSGEPRHVLIGHEAELSGANWSPDGERVLTWAWDHTARLWDAETGEPLFVLRGHEAYLRDASFSRDGRRVLTVSEDGSARIFDAWTGDAVTVLDHGKKTAVLAAAFSPDGRWVVTAAANRAVRVWNAHTGAIRSELRGHELHAYDVAWSPDNRLVATGARDTSARIWDAASGTELKRFQHDSWVRLVRFTPDGRRLISAEDKPVLHVWDVGTGKAAAVLRDYRSTADLAWVQALSSDRRLVLARTGDGQARVWRIYPETRELVTHASSLVPRVLTPEERRRFFLVGASGDERGRF